MNDPIKFYGIDILRYYWYIWQNLFAGSPWQVLVAYFIVCCCILILIILGILLFIEIRKRIKYNKLLSSINDTYYDKIKLILSNNLMMSNFDIIQILGEDYENDLEEPKCFLNIITKVRTELSDTSYFPNMNALCNILRITAYCENNLLKNTDVFKTLLFLCINQIIIIEGRLANYVNYRNSEIRMMARLCYIICAYSNNYKYLQTELNEHPSEMMFMLLHYIFDWVRLQNKELPDFKELINHVTNKLSHDFIEMEAKVQNV